MVSLSHARLDYTGTAAERAGTTPGAEAVGVRFFETDTGDLYVWDGSAWQGIGGGGAPTGAQYLVLTVDATLTAERVFVDGTNLTGTDGGAGGNYTLDLDDPILTSVDLNGSDVLTLDADADTTIDAPTDDQVDFSLGGTDVVRFLDGSGGDANVWRLGDRVLDLDFTGTDYDTVAECNAVGLRFSDSDIPFPDPCFYDISGSWSHSAGNGWQPAVTTTNEGPAIMVPLMRPMNWEFEFTINYTPADVSHNIQAAFGSATPSNNRVAFGFLLDANAAANEIICRLYTNDGDETVTQQYAGAALAGTGNRTYKFRQMWGTIGVYDELDDTWHNYSGRPSTVAGLTPSHVILQFMKYSTSTFSTLYVTNLKLTYLL